MPDPASSSFDDIAVALVLAASKLKLDLDHAEILAARIDLPRISTSLAVVELRRNIDLIAEAHRFFKENAAAEAEMRALALRKKRGTWLKSFSRVAVL